MHIFVGQPKGKVSMHEVVLRTMDVVAPLNVISLKFRNLYSFEELKNIKDEPWFPKFNSSQAKKCKLVSLVVAHENIQFCLNVSFWSRRS